MILCMCIVVDKGAVQGTVFEKETDAAHCIPLGRELLRIGVISIGRWVVCEQSKSWSSPSIL